jgi:hypothetical protein
LNCCKWFAQPTRPYIIGVGTFSRSYARAIVVPLRRIATVLVAPLGAREGPEGLCMPRDPVPAVKTGGNMLNRIYDVGLALALAAVTLAGCSTSYPRAPALAASPDYKYVLGPGDVVNIVSFRNPELSMTVPVRPDGASPRRSSRTCPRSARTSTPRARNGEGALQVHPRSGGERGR